MDGFTAAFYLRRLGQVDQAPAPLLRDTEHRGRFFLRGSLVLVDLMELVLLSLGVCWLFRQKQSVLSLCSLETKRSFRMCDCTPGNLHVLGDSLHNSAAEGLGFVEKRFLGSSVCLGFRTQPNPISFFSLTLTVRKYSRCQGATWVMLPNPTWCRRGTAKS